MGSFTVFKTARFNNLSNSLVPFRPADSSFFIGFVLNFRQGPTAVGVL